MTDFWTWWADHWPLLVLLLPLFLLPIKVDWQTITEGPRTTYTRMIRLGALWYRYEREERRREP